MHRMRDCSGHKVESVGMGVDLFINVLVNMATEMVGALKYLQTVKLRVIHFCSDFCLEF